MKQVIAVNANKSWYEGYIPLYVYFALRACPHADVLVHLMGSVDPVILRTMDELGIDRRRYKIIDNYKPDYGQTVIASKLARWTMNHDLIRGYDFVYVGDIDMFLADEGENDLFSQHLEHAERLGVPISNKIRKNEERLTGLHFFISEPYFSALDASIEALDAEIIALGSDEKAITKHFPKSDEKVLYKMVAQARPDWIEKIETSNFRPYHGAHMGNFRNTNSKAYTYLSDCVATNQLSKGQTHYLSNIYNQFSSEGIFSRCNDLFQAFPKVGETCGQFFDFVDSNRNSPALRKYIE